MVSVLRETPGWPSRLLGVTWPSTQPVGGRSIYFFFLSLPHSNKEKLIICFNDVGTMYFYHRIVRKLIRWYERTVHCEKDSTVCVGVSEKLQA